jgi:methionine sulfoxide reductase heme-binding subunit
VSRRNIALLKVLVWILCLGPVLTLLAKGFHLVAQDLGADPISVITLTTGHWTLILLLVTLSITPVRRITGWNWLIRFRRLTGLFAFFYGCLHLLTYIWFDKFFDFPEMIRDIGKRPFITMGFLAWTLMLPLALTSTTASIRKLGKRWQTLHRLIYFSATAGVIHFWWLVKKDLTRPERYALVLTVLILFRVFLWLLPWLRRQRATRESLSAG